MHDDMFLSIPRPASWRAKQKRQKNKEFQQSGKHCATAVCLQRCNFNPSSSSEAQISRATAAMTVIAEPRIC
jgi:hypothetical protein